MNARPHTVRRWPMAAIVSLAALCGFQTMSAAPTPSRFVFKEAKLILETKVGPSGSILLLPEKETTVADIRITVPPQALAKDITFRIYRDFGELTLKRGKSSGIFLRMDCGTLNQFNEPVEIEIPYQPEDVKKGTITGFAIDHDGLLSPLSVNRINREKSKVVFSTLVPLRFVWVFTEG